MALSAKTAVGLTNVSGATRVFADLVAARAHQILAFVCKEHAAKRLQWQATRSPFIVGRDSPEDRRDQEPQSEVALGSVGGPLHEGASSAPGDSPACPWWTPATTARRAHPEHVAGSQPKSALVKELHRKRLVAFRQ